MNEKLIDSVIRDYSLRELQIYSSKILSASGATNSFIAQFKAEPVRHQFEKNVIKWYMKKYQKFPEEELEPYIFKFLGNNTGLGDRFIMVSNTLYTMKELNVYNRFIVEIYSHPCSHCLAFCLTDFYEFIDFFHFERPSTQVPIISNAIKVPGNVKTLFPNHRTPYTTLPPNLIRLKSRTRKNITGDTSILDYNMQNEIYMYFNRHLYDHGKYWPIKYNKTVKKTIIAFMFYNIKGDVPSADIHKYNKFITLEEEKAFNLLKDQLTNIKFNFGRLEDLNYAKNVELLSRSHLLIASEGMWTQLSRAMNIDTIAYTNLPEFIEEFNNQGHFCSGKFEECLTKLKEKCTALP